MEKKKKKVAARRPPGVRPGREERKNALEIARNFNSFSKQKINKKEEICSLRTPFFSFLLRERRSVDVTYLLLRMKKKKKEPYRKYNKYIGNVCVCVYVCVTYPTLQIREEPGFRVPSTFCVTERGSPLAGDSRDSLNSLTIAARRKKRSITNCYESVDVKTVGSRSGE